MGAKATGRYLKPGVKCSAPNTLFAVVMDPTVTSGARTERDTFYSWGGAGVAVSHYRRGKWTAPVVARCETTDELREWTTAHAQPRARNYVVTPDGLGALAMGGIWATIDSGPVRWVPAGRPAAKRKEGKGGRPETVVRRIAVTGNRCVLDYTREGLRWLWLGARQFLGAEEEDLARELGFKWPETGHGDTSTGKTHRTPTERAALWLVAFQQLCDWWRENATAPFGMTASGLAMGILRSHVAPKTLATHNCEWTHRLERDACFGGRCSTWYFGDIDHPIEFGTEANPAPPRSQYGSIAGPLSLVDVRSMYPFLLREMSFPVRRSSYLENCDPIAPQAYAECMGVIARVTIETETPEYPCRVNGAVHYPIGRFTTTLTGPELLKLRGEGKVVKCWAMSRYVMAPAFAGAATALIAMRERARTEGNAAWELFAKTMGNGLGGKLAQAKGEWTERPNAVAMQQFGEWYEASRGDGKTRRFRALAGCVWEYERDKTGAGPYTAAFAYLTAYGRLHMRGIRDACPNETVVSMDTDGLWLLPRGRDALRSVLREGAATAGELRVDREVTAARFYGPRHYFTPGQWVLAGFSGAAVGANGRTVTDTQRFAPLAGPAGRAPMGQCVRTRSSDLAVDAPGVRVGKDGWGSPRRRRG